MDHLIYLSLGSNLGKRLTNLNNAVSNLLPKVQPLIQSSIYETEPWGYTDQPSFLNQVIKADTSMDPFELLEFLKVIEVSMGRKETFHFGPRLIDIDILFYDDIIINTPELTVPHPHIPERAFVLVPLAEIAPELCHPSFGKTIQQLRNSIDVSSVELFKPVKL